MFYRGIADNFLLSQQHWYTSNIVFPMKLFILISNADVINSIILLHGQRCGGNNSKACVNDGIVFNLCRFSVLQHYNMHQSTRLLSYFPFLIIVQKM